MEDKPPHNVCGSDFAQGEVGNLEAAIYKNLEIRVNAIEEYEQQKRVFVIDVPYFSTKTCEGLAISDLEEGVIRKGVLNSLVHRSMQRRWIVNYKSVANDRNWIENRTKRIVSA